MRDIAAIEERSWYDEALHAELKECWDQTIVWRWHKTRDAPWLRITEDSWHEALNVLPPQAWKRDSFPETFILMEMEASGELGEIAWMFGRRGARHYATLGYVREYEQARQRLAEQDHLASSGARA